MRKLRDRGPGIPMAPVSVSKPPEGGSCTVAMKLHRVIPNDLGPIGDHLVWSVIKAIKRGDDVLVVLTSEDGKSASRMSMQARKIFSSEGVR